MAHNETLSAPLNLRVTPTLRAKAEHIADKQRRKVTEWGRLVIEDAVAAYEKEHGEIKLPASE